jgi:hypothetical protein
MSLDLISFPGRCRIPSSSIAKPGSLAGSISTLQALRMIFKTFSKEEVKIKCYTAQN